MKHSVAFLFLAIGDSTASTSAIDAVKPRHLDTNEENCPGGFVDCVYGRTADGSKTCEEACEGRCCVDTSGDWDPSIGYWVGGEACDYFTGKVCKDDRSCSGSNACHFANIEIVIRGCSGSVNDPVSGGTACANAGREGGSIGRVVDSCNGRNSCFSLASFGGSVGAIVNSCNKNYACIHVATCESDIHNDMSSPHDPLCGSNLEEIISSCNGFSACSGVARFGGNMTGIYNGCNADKACYDYGAGQGNGFGLLSDIDNCCNTPSECEDATGAVIPESCLSAAPTTVPTKKPTTLSELTPSPTKSATIPNNPVILPSEPPVILSEHNPVSQQSSASISPGQYHFSFLSLFYGVTTLFRIV